MCDNYMYEIKLEKLVELVGMYLLYYLQFFKSRMYKNLIEYVIYLCMNCVKELLMILDMCICDVV